MELTAADSRIDNGCYRLLNLTAKWVPIGAALPVLANWLRLPSNGLCPNKNPNVNS